MSSVPANGYGVLLRDECAELCMATREWPLLQHARAAPVESATVKRKCVRAQTRVGHLLTGSTAAHHHTQAAGTGREFEAATMQGTCKREA